MHCTFSTIEKGALAACRSRWRQLLGRACRSWYAAPFRGDKHTYYFDAYLASFYVLSTTISCHFTFGRQRLMPFVEEGDIYNDVLSVLEDSFVTTSVNVCMRLLRTCYWASRRTCSMPTFDKEEEILGDWLSDPTPDPTDMDSVRFRTFITFM